MKDKVIMTLIVFLFATMQINAQTHNLKGGWCKYAKNTKGTARDESESARCLACDAIEKKERAAVAKADKLKAEANEKLLADKKLAAEKKRSAQLQLDKDEEKKIKDKALSDRISQNAAVEKARGIAAKGLVKSAVKGTDETMLLSDLTCFKDDQRQIYGFKNGDKEVLTKPYEGKSVNFSRIEGTNLFVLDIWNSNEKGFIRYAYSHLLDHTGKKLSIDGRDKSDYRIWMNTESKVIFFFKKISVEMTGKIVSPSNGGLGHFHVSKESALADVQSHRRAGLGMHSDMIVCYDTRYTLDVKGNLLEKSDGYTVRTND